MPNGDTCVMIYLKMLLLSLSSSGELYFDGLEPDFHTELALTLDEDEELVRDTLEFLMRVHRLEQKSETVYYLPEVGAVTGSESASAERMRKARQKPADAKPQEPVQAPAEACDTEAAHCDTPAAHCDVEKEKEIEITKTVTVANLRRHLIVGILALLMGSFALPANAQCEAKNDAFQSGEHVMYDLYFNWKFVWVKAGIASLTTNATTYHSEPAYRINLLALGSKRADFFFKMRDTLTCVMGEKLEPRYFRKGAEEGKRYTVDEAWFSYKDGLCFAKQKRTFRDGEVQESEESDSRCIYDMLTILAQARSYDPADYKVGDKIKFPMATGRKVEEQTLIYRGKENVKAENGVTYRCLIFSLVEYDKKGKEKEVITFFVTDDKNHLPVRLDMFLNFGSAKAFLNDVRGHRHPLTSIVK